MKGLIQYNDIENLKISEALDFIANHDRLVFGDITVADLAIRIDLPSIKIMDEWELALFGEGVYVFFDDNQPVYAGHVPKKHFLHRFQSHRFFDGRPDWAFNELARQLAIHKLGSVEPALNKERFFSEVIPLLEALQVVRINTLNHDIKRKRLENLLLKGFNDPPYAGLYNGLKKLGYYDASKTVGVLMK